MASIIPTSKFGIKHVCEKIDFSNCKLIVEYGPATGVFSDFLLKHMPDDANLILIERNPDFAKTLQESFDDKRVMVFNDSAENISDIMHKYTDKSANYIISGIPFSFFPSSLTDEIIAKSYEALLPEGKFLAYQTFFQKNAHLKDYLDKYFENVTHAYEPLNIPPMRIYEAVK
ncbi:hypothetical protein SYNTR_1135 [Candidatus Syntrophocurvum alkaliphilum]|uniref:Uncharacterized protein n=1 Tax=Candidatus Syntrophocurvum alkaliphilum TaxID=2293317 RepID=A0A6I6DA68_9FIRM|nr:rRNA adenine N-6-methyltransferase family protein [Candidatus Syntrophocurvum alkaliphilum]QGT99728.1 hypothetical protein SYNTR_1135 [Candidatus Syntrophocurvum alkaliphilum]